MLKWKPLLGTAVGVGLLAAVGVQAQEKGNTNSPTKAQTLTALDYIQIQQLVATYPYAFDTAGDNGNMLANLFAPDGAFIYRTRTITGRENLAAFVRGDSAKSGPSYTHIFSTNVVIAPSAEGATGKAYVVALDIGEGGKASGVNQGGHYDDVYVKTAEGWRFKKREYVLSQAGPRPELPASR